MPIPSPFHPRTAALCHSMRWKDWAGYFAVCSYEPSHDTEYFALRHAAGVIDVSPLYKYELTGPDAARFLAYVTVKDVRKLKPGRVTYLCWTDDDGKVIDDGTATNVGGGVYRLTSADPAYAWLKDLSPGFAVEIEDVTTAIGALSVQGPTARDVLASCVTGTDVAALKYFGFTKGKLSGVDVEITRTGFTGDLGYEVWCKSGDAPALYDALMKAGQAFGIMPVGLDAMDVSRIEAGFLINGVDYLPAHHCMIEERKSSPYEIGLGWTVDLRREDGSSFMGQAALQKEAARAPEWAFVGLEIDWVETETLFDSYGLPPDVRTAAWRDGRPIYDLAGHWIGMATSGAWSPTLKKNLAIGQISAPFGKEGTKVKFEVTVDYRRHTVTATVVKTPFFNPPRKRS